ncbi:hypothetical protein [Winogradskyella luteola]|uniref:Uncharacterized protein n=1 Tax=Winogradskyella luteola TaxID=2828330 RepID=A0A9X1F9U2_9FLAO|nr:hypothetical protein [Winogradskyella luteola]MBV7269952.1 hypothetical protein [Winogradskyella luteola]
MSKKLFLSIFICMLFIPLNMASQNDGKVSYKAVKYKDNVKAPLTSNELSKIQEVYQESTKKQVLDRPAYVKRIKHLLRNRFSIIQINIKEKQRNYTLLSEVDLFNHYNKNLKRDTNFNRQTFNPLKYNFDFYPSENKLYRVDGTNYFIQIKSQFQ